MVVIIPNFSKTGLKTGLGNRDNGVVASFPIWNSGIEIRDDASIIYEISQYDKAGLIESVESLQLLPKPIDGKDWEVIRQDENSITLGIPDVVEMNLQRENVKKLKANYKVFVSLPDNRIEFEVRSYEGLREKRGKSLPKGIKHSIEVNSDNITLVGNYGNFVVYFPDNNVGISYNSATVRLTMPNDAIYPFEFDPPVYIDTTVYDYGTSGANVMRISDSYIHVAYIDSDQDAQYAYSDDDGATFEIPIRVSGSYNYQDISLTFDSNEDAFIVYGVRTVGIWYKKYTHGSGLGIQNTIVSSTYEPGYCDCDMGPNDYLQVVYQLKDSGITYRIYHWDAYTTTSTQMSYSGNSIHCAIQVDGDNAAHMAFGQAYSGARDRSIGYVKKDWNSTKDALIYVVIEGSADACFQPSIALDSTGYIYVAYQDYDSPVNGTPNVRVFGMVSEGSSFSLLGNMTDSSYHNNSRRVYLGVDGNDILYVFFNDVSGYGGYAVTAYRYYDSGTWTPALTSNPTIYVEEYKEHYMGSPFNSFTNQDGTAVLILQTTNNYLMFYTDIWNGEVSTAYDLTPNDVASGAVSVEEATLDLGQLTPNDVVPVIGVEETTLTPGYNLSPDDVGVSPVAESIDTGADPILSHHWWGFPTLIGGEYTMTGGTTTNLGSYTEGFLGFYHQQRKAMRRLDGRLYFVFINKWASTDNIFLFYSDSPYSTWYTKQLTSDTDTAYSSKYNVAACMDSEGKIYVVYNGKNYSYGSGTTTHIRYLKYHSINDTIDTYDRAVAYCSGVNQGQPTISVDGDGVAHIAWNGKGWGTNTSYEQPCYTSSDTGNYTWPHVASTNEPYLLADEAHNAKDVQLDICNNSHVYVMWRGYSSENPEPSYRQILLRQYTYLADDFWDIEHVTSTPDDIDSFSLCIDRRTNLPAVAYGQYPNLYLMRKKVYGYEGRWGGAEKVKNMTTAYYSDCQLIFHDKGYVPCILYHVNNSYYDIAASIKNQGNKWQQTVFSRANPSTSQIINAGISWFFPQHLTPFLLTTPTDEEGPEFIHAYGNSTPSPGTQVLYFNKYTNV